MRLIAPYVDATRETPTEPIDMIPLLAE